MTGGSSPGVLSRNSIKVSAYSHNASVIEVVYTSIAGGNWSMYSKGICIST